MKGVVKMSNLHNLTNSSSINAIDHDGDSLIIHFASGGTYKYSDCPVIHHEALKNAASAGKYFHQNIRGKFNETKLA
jgi:sorbitol-specific phosphotransferase system component IIA